MNTLRKLSLLIAICTGSAFAMENMLPGEHVMPSEEFLAQEEVERQHTFIQLGEKGEFGYHVSLFLQNHQHQLVVSSELAIDGMSQSDVESFLSVPADNGYYTALTDKPRFVLQDIISGRRSEIPVDVYDGIIGIDSESKLFSEATFTVKEILFTTPMHVEDMKLEANHYIVVGNEGGDQTRYFLIHLIWGAANYDQVVEAEFSSPVKIENGTLIKIDGQPDDLELSVGQEAAGILAEESLNFSVTRQIHFRRL